MAEPAWDWVADVAIPSPFIIIILFIFFMFTSICIVRYQFSVLSDPTTLKEEIQGAVAEAMVSTKDVISEAVGSAILTNMRVSIAIKLCQTS